MTEKVPALAEAEPPPRNWRSFWCLIGMQVQNAFNDNMARFILVPLGTWLVSRGAGFSGIEHALSALLVLPYILFAPSSGWLADRFPKSAVIRGAAWLQLGVLGLMAGSLALRSLPLAMVSFFILALQSTLLSPAKMGIVKELLGTRKLAYASGMMEGTVILAILAGMILGGVWFDWRLEAAGSGWTAALVPVVWLWIGGAISIALAYGVQRTRAMTTEKYSAAVAFRHFADLRAVWRDRRLRQVTLGVGYFWGFAGFMSLVVVQIAKELHGGGAGTGTTNSALMAAASVGIAVGSIAAGRMSRRGIELGLVPVGGVVMTLGAFALVLTPSGTWLQYAMLLVAGAGGAVFLVPLHACVMDWPAESERGKVLAVSNLLNNGFGIGAVALQFAMGTLGLAPRWQFLVVGLLTLAVTVYVVKRLPVNFVRVVGLAVIRTLYRVRTVAPERMPESGGVLLVPNHVSFADAFFLSAASPRPVRFLMTDDFYSKPWVRPFARLFGSVPISRKNTREAIGQVAEALATGDVVCVFPEGQITRTGFLNELKRGYELMAKRGGAAILPAYQDGVWGSIFSFERGRFVRKRPYRIPYGLTVAFGPVLEPAEGSVERVRAELRLAAAAALAARVEDAWRVERRVFADPVPEVLQGRSEAERRRFSQHMLQLANVGAWPRRAVLWLCPEAGRELQALVHGFARAFRGRVEVGVPEGATEPAVVIGGAAMRRRLAGLGKAIFFDVEAEDGPDSSLGDGIFHAPCLLRNGRLLAMSLPEPPAARNERKPQPGRRDGSTGRLLPGWVIEETGDRLAVEGPALEEPVALPPEAWMDAEDFLFLRRAVP